MEQLLFFKNIAIAGGLLILASVGAGEFSVDGLKNPQKIKLT
jgi:putative oxidoreductase